MIEAQACQSVQVCPRVHHERCGTKGADDAAFAAWRCQELPTAQQQQPEQDFPVFAPLYVH
jgi:hypothetical protein